MRKYLESYMAKVVWLSDLDIVGSGYRNITIPLCRGLSDKHDVKVIGLKYKREEHYEPFSILPADNIQEAQAMVHNLREMWDFDTLIIALDIPLQIRAFIQAFPDREFDYFGVFPVEADPLIDTWALGLSQMDKQFIISKFGTEEAHKAGLDTAEYIEIAVDTESWRPPTSDEKKQIRQSFGLSDDSFSVLTVADNQERKHLSRAMEMFADLLYDYPNVNAEIVEEKGLEPALDARYSIVTREHNPVGWELRDYAKELGISNQFMLFERGIEFDKFWSLYAMSDVFLLTSKAEGLGMPLLEAMAVELPCVATNCTGMRELLSDDRGYLIDYDYVHRDPFGNGRRYFASRKHGVELLKKIQSGDLPDVKKTRKFVEDRSWDWSVEQLDKAICE